MNAPDSKPRRSRSRVLRGLVLSTSLLIVLYTAAGFWIVPGFVQNLLVDQMDQLFGLQAGIEEVSFNPLSLTLRVEGVSLHEPGSEPLLSFDELVLRLSMKSLPQQVVSLAEVELVRLRVLIDVRPDGTTNLAPLLSPDRAESPETEEADGGEPLRLALQSFRMVEGEIRFRDQRSEEPFETTVHPLNVHLNDFTTHLDRDEAYTLTAAVQEGGRLTCEGIFRKSPFSSRVELKVEGFALRTLWRYLRDEMGIEIKEGSLGLTASLSLDLSTVPLTLKLEDCGLTIDDLRISPRDKDLDLARLEHFELSGLKVDLAERSATAALVETHGAELLALRNEKGEVETLEYFTFSDRVTNLTAFAQGSWQWQLDEFRLRDYEFAWVDETIDLREPLSLSISIDNANAKPESAASVAIEAEFEGGSLQVNGSAGLNPAVVDVGYVLGLSSLDVASSYIDAELPIRIARGRLDVDGSFDLGTGATQAYANLYADVKAGGVALDLGEGSLGELVWESLQISDGHLTLDPMDWTVERIALRKPNLSVTLLAQDSVQVAESSPSERASAAEAPPVTDSPTAEEAPPEVLSQHIGTLEILDGSLAFADSSVSPPVRVALHDFSVTAGGAAGPKGTTRVSVEALLNGEAPLLITGFLDPARPERHTQLSGTLHGYDLMDVQGYAIKYVGWTLKSGTVSLDLVYDVESTYLDSRNRIHLSGLEMGERVESPGAINLPLGTAVPLMRDNQGNIDLNVNVSGDLDDSSFDVGKVIVDELTGLVVKVIKAPFHLLGGLVGIEGDELNFVTFTAGHDSIRSPEVAKLQHLEAALLERPGVRLEVEGVAFEEQDAYAIQVDRLEADLLALWREDQRDDRDPNWSDEGADRKSVPVEDREELMLRLYEIELGKKQKDDDPVAARHELRALREISESDLIELGHRRADGIRAQLLASGEIDDTRIRLADPKLVHEPNHPIRAQLKIRD